MTITQRVTKEKNNETYKTISARRPFLGFLRHTSNISPNAYTNFYATANSDSNIHSNLNPNRNACAYTSWRWVR